MYKFRAFLNNIEEGFKDKIYNMPSYTRSGVGSLTYAATSILFMYLSNVSFEQMTDEQKGILSLCLYLGSMVASHQFDKIGSYVLAYSAAIKDWAFRKKNPFENAKLSVQSIYEEIKQGSFGDAIGYNLIAVPFLIYNLSQNKNLYDSIFRNVLEAPDFGNSLVAALSILGVAYLAGFFSDITGDVADSFLPLLSKIFSNMAEISYKTHELYQKKKGNINYIKKPQITENKGVRLEIVEGDKNREESRQKTIMKDSRIQEAFQSKNIRDFLNKLNNLSDLNLNDDEKRILIQLFNYHKRQNDLL